MSRCLALSLVLSVLYQPVVAQWWADAGLPLNAANEVLQLYVNSAANTMYATGTLAVLSDSTGTSPRFCEYDNGEWSMSPSFDQFVLTAIVFHDTLYVGGRFTSVDGVPVTYIARRINGQWSSAGGFDSSILRLAVLGGELYAVGEFNYVDGQLCQGLAKRSGSAWQPVVPIGCDYCSVRDITLYNGELHVTGTILFPGGPYRHVMRLHEGSWIPVGEVGLFGGLSAGNTLEVYGAHLYMGGLFQLNDGNVGDAIMRWNGEAWSAVGTGVQDETGGYDQWTQVSDLLVHDDLLYVAGGFSYAGNVPANRIATWDGSEWCSIGGNFGDWPVSALGFYNDTLLAGCWYEADGEPVNHLAKFIAPAYEGNCSVPMTLKPASSPQVELVNLGGSSYSLRGHSGISIAKLYNTIGQVTGSWAIRGETPFDLPLAATGAHVLWIEGLGARKLLEQQ